MDNYPLLLHQYISFGAELGGNFDTGGILAKYFLQWSCNCQFLSGFVIKTSTSSWEFSFTFSWRYCGARWRVYADSITEGIKKSRRKILGPRVRTGMLNFRHQLILIVPRLRCQTKRTHVQTIPRWNMLMSKLSQTKNLYIQSFVRSKASRSRRYVQNFMLSPDMRVLKRFVCSSCVRKWACPDFRAIIRSCLHFFCVVCAFFVSYLCDYRAMGSRYVQIFIRSIFFCVLRALKSEYVQVFVSSPNPSSVRNLCVLFVRSRRTRHVSPDFRALKSVFAQAFKRSCPELSPFLCIYVVQSILKNFNVQQNSRVQKCPCKDFRLFKITYDQIFVRSFVFPDQVILNARRPPPPLVYSFWYGHYSPDRGQKIDSWLLDTL